MSNQLTDKEFSTWQARFALLGQRLTRSNPADGPESYFITRWGLAKELNTVMELQEFHSILGGKLHD